MRTTRTRGRLILALAAIAVALLGQAVVSAAPVAAAVGDLTGQGCISNEPIDGCQTAPEAALKGARTTVVSPDGANLYAANMGSSSVTSYARSSSGALTQIGCIAYSAIAGCTTASPASLEGARGIAISPDGVTVYVVSQTSDSITWFTRTPADGLLAQAGCIANEPTAGCTTAPQSSIERAYGVAVSPDGKNVYVASGISDSVTWFSRSAGTGALTQQGCLSNAPIAGCTTASPASFDFSVGVAVSPDGRFVYVASGGSRAVNWLSRDPASGALAQTGCITDIAIAGCANAPYQSMEFVVSVALSPDGTSAYTVGYNANALTSFSRNTMSGVLAQTGCISEDPIAGCSGAPEKSLQFPYGVAVSPDGASVYASAYTFGVVTTLARAAGTGLLTWAGCVSSMDIVGCTTWTPDSLVGGAFGLSVSPDGASVYVSSAESDAITWFARKRAQTITFAQPPTVLLSAGTAALVATASSGLPTVFASSTPAVCTVAGSSAELVAAGTCTVAASQPGGVSWEAAGPVVRSFAVVTRQEPVDACVTAPNRVPRRGDVRVMKASCLTNAGQRVVVRVRCRIRSRGDLRVCALLTSRRGAAYLRSYGWHATIRLTWSAPAVGSYPAYLERREYRT